MADSDARAKAAKLKAKARKRRQAKQAMEDTPDEDLRESAKSKRRKLKEKGKSAGKNVAGTLKSVAGTVSEKAKGAVSGSDSDETDGSESIDSDAQESRTETFARGLSKIGRQLGEGGAAFAEKAKEYEPQAAEGPGSEGENDAAAASVLAGSGFGGPGDPPTLVGVDENRDGQFQRDEIAFLGPPEESQSPEQPTQQQRLRKLKSKFGFYATVVEMLRMYHQSERQLI